MAKFVFSPTKAKAIKRPVNVLDKKPGDYDIVSLESEILEVMEKSPFDPSKLLSNKPQAFKDQPEFMDLKVKILGVARSIQRPYDINHSTKIAYTNWDSRRPLFPIVVYNPKTEEWLIVEGNHTSIAQGIRAANGCYPDVDKENWRELEIRCQVITLKPDENGNVDMSFCRDHFIGTNDSDRKKLDDFDFYKNYVLKVRQDLAGDVDKCDDAKAIHCYRLQLTAESWDIFPVHPSSGVDRHLAGAITHTAAFMKLKIDDVHFIGKNHKKFWDNEPVDSIELNPLSVLRNLIDQNRSNVDEFNSPQHEQFMYEMAVVMQKFGTTPSGFREFAVKVYEEYYKRTALIKGKKTPSVPADFSLVLWLKLHKKVGGKYNCIPADVYNKFKEGSIDAVDCIPNGKLKIFKEFV